VLARMGSRPRRKDPMSRRVRITTIAFLVSLGLTCDAMGAGGAPIPLEDVGGQGVAATDGSYRYVTLRQWVEGSYETTLLKIDQDGGEVVKQRTVHDDFAVPSVAYDGTSTGLSHDGSTLALIEPRDSLYREQTKFLLLNAERLNGGSGRIALDGDFSLDALSPDGKTLYLIEHPDRKDFGTYQVRSFDIATQKLDPEPILDSEEEPGEMRGFPQTRVTSADGRWENTLYDGGEHPFIHALNVAEGVTVCIDLDMIHARQTYGATLGMSEDGGQIQLTDRKGELRAVVDTETFEAREPVDEASATIDLADDESGVPTGVLAGGVVLLGLGGIVLLRRRE
jgi:MYXO-CTERM domain-containing protein